MTHEEGTSVNQRQKRGIFGVLAIAATLGVTGAVLQSQNGFAQRETSRIVHSIASTGTALMGSPGEGLSLAALRLATPKEVEQGDDYGKVAFVVAQMLERDHYSRTKLNDEISAKFLDEYMDTLDPLHIYFIQSDMKEFEKYRTTLDDLILKGDTSTAQIIFDRFKERLNARVAFTEGALKSDKFEFTGEDTFNTDRKETPHPATLEEAQALWQSLLRYEYLGEKLNKQKPEEIVKTLNRRYTRLARAIKERDASDVQEIYLSTLLHVYDPHSDYRGKANTASFNIQMSLSLFGIGAQLASEDGYVKIMELIPGGPAIKSKQLKPGDRIVAVGQGTSGDSVDAVDMKVDKVVEMIRGPKGTPVRLTVIPADAPDTSTRKIVTLIRDQIRLEEQAAKARLIEMPTENGKTARIGIIELPSFYGDEDSGKSATKDVAALVKKLQEEKAEGIILDLRRNGGGRLDEAVSLTGLFIKSGPVVQVRDSYGNNRVLNDDNPVIAYDGPLVVMTSRLSASASEIVAGALQDYGRAVVIGDTSTFGKGTVQTIVPLGPIMKSIKLNTNEDPGSLTVTIQKFYRPSGASTQLEGVKPDIALPSLTEVLDIAEKSLDHPLPYDTIPAAQFSKTNRVQPFLPELRQRSATRITSDKGFVILKEQVAQTQKTIKEKVVSLNEATRKSEREEAEKRAKAWRKEIAALGESKDRIYPLTPQDASRPGLPGPMTAKQLADASKQTAAQTKIQDPENKEEEETANLPERDILLDETKRLLLDYIALSKK